MKCQYCENPDTKVIDKRDIEEGAVIRRRRECLKCEKRFTTYERIETSNIVVIKKSGNRVAYGRDKLQRGIMRACEKRPISVEQIDKIIAEIECILRNQETTEVSSKFIGQQIMKKLKKLDKIAYIRFASVYREFEDISSFEKELEKLNGKKRG